MKVNGCLVDSLEQGTWHIYDTTNQLSEWGEFDQGIRKGTWHYLNESSDSVVNWNKYLNNRLVIATNIPEVLKVALDSSFFVKFSHKDSGSLLNLVIAVNNPIGKEAHLDSFYLYGEKDISDKGWKYKSNRNRIAATGQHLYFNDYTLYPGDREEFRTLTFYGNTPKGDLVEVTCSFAPRNEQLARLIFTSVVPNLFVDSVRFINPFDKIQLNPL